MTRQMLETDFGSFPLPPEMVELHGRIKWRTRDRGWPDMRTTAGRKWVKMFRAFSDEKRKEYSTVKEIK